MPKIIKLIIPLLGGGIRKKDLTEEAGFVDAFDDDKNEPQLENCIFLMYKPGIQTLEAKNRYERFKKLPNLYKWKHVSIDGKIYIVYVFKVISYQVKQILESRNPTIFGKESIYKVLKFWEGDSEILKHVICDEKWPKEGIHQLPEEDYRQNVDDVYHVYKEKSESKKQARFYCFNTYIFKSQLKYVNQI